ncbi:2-nitropropane dioxygenase [Oceanobacillus zhaokaii]|jgi:NAD(P)H-dependent flavin oxidoreductase YrpB (nitropropane dioxygenase family)|uniref:Probable nitronate monooxygenase n=1 Tax=Oceanobacillus zhaokaii TaxID=2052660 RepID=A0A345PG25_9BACI|nr:nitronate monooxygenase family protein [Oceanobacillus zhaokaii]AXI08955.1 2-nitropropane dioxygenase [Oceanobacillus zhaokaii]
MKINTRITTLLNIKYPIIQGGLAYLAYSDLAAAVSNAGGLGQITAMSLPGPDELRKEIKRVKSLTTKPYGVNFAIGQHGRPFVEMVHVAIEEKVPVISVTGGNPKAVIEITKGHNIKTLVLVAAKRQAKKAEELGADAVMVVGQEGGGHLGRNDLGTFVLTPEVVDHVSIPVIASGGIVDGRGLMAALSLGAEGIEMGTRFIATKECIAAHTDYKQAIVDADENSTIVIKRSIGAPARALRNSWTEDILAIEKLEQGYESIKEYISGDANKRYIYDGNLNNGFGWAGQSSVRIHDIPTVDELIRSIVSEADSIRNAWKF